MKDTVKLYPKPSSPCNCMNIRRASRAVTQLYDAMLQPSGLTITQMGLLKVIDALSAPSMSDLAAAFRIDRTTLNRNLKPLEEGGYLQLQRGQDARRREAVLTSSGRQALQEAQRLWNEAQQTMADYLGKDDLQQLKSILSKLEAMVP